MTSEGTSESRDQLNGVLGSCMKIAAHQMGHRNLEKPSMPGSAQL